MTAHISLDCQSIDDAAAKLPQALAFLRGMTPKDGVHVSVSINVSQHWDGLKVVGPEPSLDEVVRQFLNKPGAIEVLKSDAPAKEEAAPAAEDRGDPEETGVVTKDDLIGLLNHLSAKRKSSAKGREILGQFGGTRISDIAEEQWPMLYAKLKAEAGF